MIMMEQIYEKIAELYCSRNQALAGTLFNSMVADDERSFSLLLQAIANRYIEELWYQFNIDNDGDYPTMLYDICDEHAHENHEFILFILEFDYKTNFYSDPIKCYFKVNDLEHITNERVTLTLETVITIYDTLNTKHSMKFNYYLSYYYEEDTIGFEPVSQYYFRYVKDRNDVFVGLKDLKAYDYLRMNFFRIHENRGL